jgi:hypothetical protein
VFVCLIWLYVSAATALNADSSPSTVALLLRKQILASMADKMVGGLRQSTVRDITDVRSALICLCELFYCMFILILVDCGYGGASALRP